MLAYTQRVLHYYKRPLLPFIHVITLLAIVILYNSCSSTKNIDFQILKPANIRIGSNYKNVYIHCEFCNQEDIISELEENEQTKARISLNFLFSLKETLHKSPIFKDASIQTVSTSNLLNDLKDYKSRLKSEDLVIVLDNIYLNDSLVKIKSEFGSNLYTQCLIYKFGCKVYEKKNLQLIDHYMLQDSSFYPLNIFMTRLVKDSVVRDVLWNTGIKAGEDYAHYLAPYWVDVTRKFSYYHNNTFKKAFNCIQKGELDTALNILQDVNNTSKHKKIKARTVYDIAIIYELKDDFENALQMAEASDTLHNSKLTKDLIKKLRIRKIDKLALDWQVN
jgi:hypothetical protein